jgi:hypothetical protein
MVFFCFSDFTIALLLQDRVAVIMSFYLSFRYIYTENTIWTLEEDCWAWIYRTKEGWTGSCLNRMENVHFVVGSQIRQCYVHMLVENLEVFRVTSSCRRRHAMVVFCFPDFTIALLFQNRVAVIMSFYLFFRYIYRKHYMNSRRGLLICRNLSHKRRLV